MLTPEMWLYLKRFFGPHSFDLMSLDSNCQRDRNGNALLHLTSLHLLPTPGPARVNVFVNPLPARQNICVFPPFTLVVPDFHTHIVLDVLHNGSSVTYNGTFGLFDVSASDVTAFASAIRSQVARI